MRILARVILTVMLLCGLGGMASAQMIEFGFDRLGGDYTSSTGIPNPGQCASFCQSQAACRAWTWVKPGVQGPTPVCFLKNVVPQQSPNACCASGVKLAGPLPPSGFAGKDRPGADYTSINLPSAQPKACADACNGDMACKAWTYVNPGIQGPGAICYLKNSVPAEVGNPCCVSGVKAALPPPPMPLPPGAVMGKDRPGSDFAASNLPAADPNLCFNQCQANGSCKAWTYVKPGVQGPMARCYLKNVIPPAVDNPCCVSGVKAALPPPPTPLPPGAVMGKDRPGADFASSNLPVPDPNLCFDQCQANGSCKAWTYVKPGVQGPKARCWLKNAIPPAVSNPCCISGVKAGLPPPPPAGAFEKHTNRPGGDYLEFALGGKKTAPLCMAACAAQGKCKAWTFVKPGFQGPQAHCWLKATVPPPVPDACCTSGVK